MIAWCISLYNCLQNNSNRRRCEKDEQFLKKVENMKQATVEANRSSNRLPDIIRNL